jgi:TetR/AcrR family transcriptional repressor of nem operon
MKVTKEKAAEHRSAIVDSASKLFREKGIEGVGVAELTAAAGLTHGGFYRHFDSKEALFKEACLQAFAEASALRSSVLKRPGGEGLFPRGYLASERVGGTPECPVATLACEVARQGPEVQAAFASGLRTYLGSDDYAVGSPEWNQSAARMALLIGTLVMARSVHRADKVLADAVVAAALKELQLDTARPKRA